MRGEPGNRECGNGIVLREVLLWGFVLGPPKAVDFDFDCDFDFDFDFGKRTIVIVAGRVWESGKPVFGFPQLPCCLGSVGDRTVHFAPRDFASSASLAFCICCAVSVSLIRMACCCSSGGVMPAFKRCSQPGSEASFSYGVR